MAAKSMEDITALFKEFRFRKKLIGGVDEADVWRQLDMLQKEYRATYEAQEERLCALIDERDDIIDRLESQLDNAGEAGDETEE